MLPAPTLDSILTRRANGRQTDADGRRLVSVLFASPDTAVFSNLKNNMAYFDARSGDMWDLFVAGYYAYGRSAYDPHGFPLGISNGHTEWWFSPARFNELRRAVGNRHEGARSQVGVVRGRRVPWNYSGSPELVNFWVQGVTPDWNSLVAQPLTDDPPAALGHVVETHTDWRDRPLPNGFRPGTRPRVAGESLHVDAVRAALSWAVAGAAGAGLAEGVTALIKALTG